LGKHRGAGPRYSSSWRESSRQTQYGRWLCRIGLLSVWSDGYGVAMQISPCDQFPSRSSDYALCQLSFLRSYRLSWPSPRGRGNTLGNNGYGVAIDWIGGGHGGTTGGGVLCTQPVRSFLGLGLQLAFVYG
jgi:hypothetical protein